MVWCRRKAFYLFMIKYQSFSRPVSWGCEFHKCLSGVIALFSPLLLREIRKGGRLEHEKYPYPMWEETQIRSFSLESRPLLQRVSGCISQRWLIPSPLLESGEDLYYENLVGFLEAKSRKGWGFPKTVPPPRPPPPPPPPEEFLNLQLVYIQPPAMHCHLTSLWLPGPQLQGNRSQPW